MIPALPAEVGVFHQNPDPALLSPDLVCGACGVHECRPVAIVAWSQGDEPGRWRLSVGAECLSGFVCEVLDRRAGAGLPVEVDVPQWTVHELADAVGLSPGTALSWWKQQLLTDATPSGPDPLAPRRFLADQVHHAQKVRELRDIGLDAGPAHRLLTGTEQQRSIARGLLEALGPREAVSA